MYHKYPGLGSSPEEKLALRVFGSKCWKTQPVGTQEVVFDGLCFGGCVVRASQGDPPWGRQLHANHQGHSWVPAGQKGDQSRGDSSASVCFDRSRPEEPTLRHVAESRSQVASGHFGRRGSWWHRAWHNSGSYGFRGCNDVLESTRPLALTDFSLGVV